MRSLLLLAALSIIGTQAGFHYYEEIDDQGDVWKNFKIPYNFNITFRTYVYDQTTGKIEPYRNTSTC